MSAPTYADGRRVLWYWVVPPDQYTADDRLFGDINSEYAIVEVDAPTGIMVMARYHLAGEDGPRWHANPSGRPVIAELLRLLQAAGEPTATDPLHPFGRCTCAGEGRCEWCRLPCGACDLPRNSDVDGGPCLCDYGPSPPKEDEDGKA